MPHSEKDILENMTVLYVEDDDETRKGITDFLKFKVKKIHTAKDGKQGIELYKKAHPDIIITDIRMPGLSGIEMARRIKAINPDIPFVITTAHNDVEYLVESIDMGINQFLLKPVIGSKLVESLYKCMKNFSLEQQLVEIAGLLTEYKNAIDASCIVLKFDRKGQIIYVNDAYCQVSGYAREEILGKPFQQTGDPDATYGNRERDMWGTIRDRRIWRNVLKCLRKDGTSYYMNATIVPISDSKYNIVEFMFIAYEVTELIEKEEELLRQLYTDRMTGLPNRTKLLEDVEETLYPVLILINVDSFQQINDLYGNEIGDRLLTSLGVRLQSILPSQDYRLYKMPTDEYAVLFNKKLAPREVEPIAKSINEEVSYKPFPYNNNSIRLSVAMGIAIGDDRPENPEGKSKWHALALNADMALKKAKRMNKAYIIYDESMQISKEYEHNINWTAKLQESIQEDRIVPFFQPIINNKTGKVEEYECLVRMIDRDGAVKSPVFFLDLSKRNKLYYHLTRIMLQKSMAMFRESPYRFSINLSVDDIIDEETNRFILDILRKNPDVAQRMVFEILESEGIENYEEVKTFIENLKEIRCKIAIDDFGAGYSNFSHILKLHVDYIKIDASLTQMVNLDKNYQIIIQTIVDFSRKLGIKTIAEFVHSREVFEKTRELGVDYSQGYYFGEPKASLG